MNAWSIASGIGIFIYEDGFTIFFQDYENALILFNERYNRITPEP